MGQSLLDSAQDRLFSDWCSHSGDISIH